MKKELEYEESLTNEQLLKRFKNQFELVRYAMQLAENAIRSGRELNVDTDSQNVAFQVLAEISANTERFEEIPVSYVEERKAPQEKRGGNDRKNSQEGGFSKAGKEVKKERKSKATR
jgi:hypothetical protein